jgi:predicted secreted Zn-dependent protease
MALADDHAGDHADQGSTDHFGAVTLSEYSFNLGGDPTLETQDMRDSCRCAVRDTIEIELMISVRYPVWVDRAACEDSSLVEDWKRYITNLYRHELGHTYIARAGLGKLRRRLNGLRAYGTGAECAGACSRATASYNDRVRQAFLEITGEISQEQERYDRQTGYGKSQGATF